MPSSKCRWHERLERSQPVVLDSDPRWALQPVRIMQRAVQTAQCVVSLQVTCCSC